MENFWIWAKTYGLYYGDNIISGEDQFEDFKKELWFSLIKCMRKKHKSALQGYLKYIHNHLVKNFRVIILQYSKRIHEMHNIANPLPPTSNKIDLFDQAYWRVCYIEFTGDEIRIATKDGLLPYM